MAKLFGRFLLLGEEASFANTKCEWLVKWIRAWNVDFVLELSFLCGGFESFWVKLSKNLVFVILAQFRLSLFIAVAVDFALIDVTGFSRHKIYARVPLITFLK